MSGFGYYLATIMESGLSVFGVRAPYEQPRYEIMQSLPDSIEIRQYGPRHAVETAIDIGYGGRPNEGEAFGRLFRYITGANEGASKIAMTVPVERSSQRIAMTVPVEMAGGSTMRFFLPEKVAAAGPPVPTDPKVHIVSLPAVTLGVIRFSGVANDATRVAHEDTLRKTVTGAGWTVSGPASFLSYDPPFALPFLRRNEVALPLTKPPA